MRTTTKGALAAGAAATLLLGGASSLAYWNDSGTVNGGTITSGNLKLTSNCTAQQWTVTNSLENKSNVAIADISTFRAVPGDVLTKSCTVTVLAIGDNLRANLAATPVTGGPASTMDSGAYSVNPTFKIGANTIGSITSADTGKTVDATIVVNFPIGSAVDNSSKARTIVVPDYTVTATQATTQAS
jgi:alternate signal-mediated exported protein